MVIRRKWLGIFFAFFAVGFFLTTAHAEEHKRNSTAEKSDRAGHGANLHQSSDRGANLHQPDSRGANLSHPAGSRANLHQSSDRGTNLHQPARHGENQHQFSGQRTGSRQFDGHRENRHHFSGHDYHHWRERDRRLWRGGSWRHEEYMGRYGYWYVVGGMRYFYETPVYPYPLIVPEIAYEVSVEAPVEQVVVAPEPSPKFKPQIQAPVWYYCDDPAGYSPYVSSCPSGWRTVPAKGPTPPR